MAKNIYTVSNQRPSKIYPNWDFWFEIKPSGNPGPAFHVAEHNELTNLSSASSKTVFPSIFFPPKDSNFGRLLLSDQPELISGPG
jgi:hypothetical protein